MKKRKRLIESSLDNPLSSAQKVALEEIISLFPQMSPRAIVADTLRILDAIQQCTLHRRYKSLRQTQLETDAL
ncbi:hypothetical protein ALC53_06055 [Atta colombica]|uniref:Uncharacterized protein n=1 Tax=Atta colombica TaxID=520822 RepID=A0A151I3J3_9HYME|nr:hypothetical protein ALC53_06055 [Atta colombica]